MRCRSGTALSVGLGGVLAVTLGVGPGHSAVAADESMGTLQLAIVDAGTGEGVSARVGLLDGEGKSHVAEDALPIYTWEVTAEPVRTIENPYTGTTQFYAGGGVRAVLPAGTYRLMVTKGIEYRTVARAVEIRAGQETKLTVRLERWADMPAKGWYSSDVHLHIARRSREVDPQISRWMQAEDIHVANLLQWGHSKSFDMTVQYAHGPGAVYQDGKYILAAGQENPRTHFLGHTITLGAKSAIHFPEQYVVYRRFWAEAQQQRALIGYAHFGQHLNAQFGLSLDLPLGLLTFLQVLESGAGVYRVWYDILNTGFRLTPTAGTDYPALPSLQGRERFYTWVEGEFGYDNWLAGVQAGRTFVTNGPLLEFHVAGARVGDDVRLNAPGTVRIEGAVRFDPKRDDVNRVEVIANGDLIRSIPRRGEASEIRFAFDHDVRRDSWFAVRADGHKVDEPKLPRPASLYARSVTQTLDEAVYQSSLAHSAPIYVTIQGGVPLAEQPAARAQARAWLARLDHLRERLSDDQIKHLAAWPSAYDGVELDMLLRNRPALLEAIETARRHFEEQAREP